MKVYKLMTCEPGGVWEVRATLLNKPSMKSWIDSRHDRSVRVVEFDVNEDGGIVVDEYVGVESKLVKACFCTECCDPILYGKELYMRDDLIFYKGEVHTATNVFCSEACCMDFLKRKAIRMKSNDFGYNDLNWHWVDMEDET